MAEDGEGFDFEALDDDSSELSALVTATPSSSIAGEEGDAAGAAGGHVLSVEAEVKDERQSHRRRLAGLGMPCGSC